MSLIQQPWQKPWETGGGDGAAQHLPAFQFSFRANLVFSGTNLKTPRNHFPHYLTGYYLCSQ